jgi:hypothetical protein
MNLTELYSKIQKNPLNKAIYWKLIDFYKSAGMRNESAAFEYLIKNKFNDNSTDTDKK